MLIPPQELADVELGLMIDSWNRNPLVGKGRALRRAGSSAISFCIGRAQPPVCASIKMQFLP
ncbi:MAG TPA: hypothetical protein VHB49_07030 [Bradyrhizobium sp.]|nr:hypothetical protein [Bradyrhizobium sp.]